ncbi:MAG: LacI family DNA-binding transcriptional regulator [Chloroflexi bacterium]|nr:LacI family DNA-binding transcriptional regulator [Chloroflexota bacterium]
MNRKGVPTLRDLHELPLLDGPRHGASMREVAERANVAISSVSRVLSGHPDVSRPMRERVMEAVRELEYEPHFLAQSLRRGATLSVGMVINDISNPVQAEVALGAESALRAAGYSMMLMNSENDPALDAAHIRFLRSRRVDGMLLSFVSDRAEQTVEQLRQLDRPVVVIDREPPADVGASTVLVDHAAGMNQAVAHLLELGHRRIGLVAGPADVRPGYARIDAMYAAVARGRAGARAFHLSGPFTPQFGEAATHELLDDADPPTAILAGSNLILIGCLRAIERRGVRVGRDLSLVACDDVPLAELYSPPLSVIRRDTIELGRTAAKQLLRRLGDDTGPERTLLPTTFIPRSSTVPPAQPADAKAQP